MAAARSPKGIGRIFGRRKAPLPASPQPTALAPAVSAPAPAKKAAVAKAAAAAQPAPASKPVPATRAARAKAVPATKTAPGTKQPVPLTKAAPVKTAVRKAAPVTKAAAPAKAAPVKTAVRKAAPATKAAAPAKAAPAKAAPATTAVRTAAPAKKAAPVKKAAPARPAAPVALTGDDAWTKTELTAMRKALDAQALELRGEITDAESLVESLKRDASTEGSGDEADAGTKTFEREHEMSLANNSRDLLLQIERALARLDEGSYGRCEDCGKPIPKARLQAAPRATLCVSCKQREERR